MIIFSGWPILVPVNYDPTMSDKPDLQQLAARYLDLWQEQMASLSSDPAVTTLMAQSYALARRHWQEAADHINKGSGAQNAGPGDAANADFSADFRPSGTKTTAVSPDGASDQPDLVLHRLAALEERVAQLEARLAKRSRTAPADRQPGRRRVPPRAD
jgi:hypothetical protein